MKGLDLKHAELYGSCASRFLHIIFYCYYKDAAKYLTDELFLALNPPYCFGSVQYDIGISKRS